MVGLFSVENILSLFLAAMGGGAPCAAVPRYFTDLSPHVLCSPSPSPHPHPRQAPAPCSFHAATRGAEWAIETFAQHRAESFTHSAFLERFYKTVLYILKTSLKIFS